MLNFQNLIKLDILIQAFLILKLLDFATGFLKAYKIEGWRSKKIRDGVTYLMSEFIAFIFAGILDELLGLNILLISVKWLFIYKESISISENLSLLGVNLPDIIKQNLEVIKAKSMGKKDDEDKGVK